MIDILTESKTEVQLVPNISSSTSKNNVLNEIESTENSRFTRSHLKNISKKSFQPHGFYL